MMDERDRIDIIATLHDRFNRPADEILRKMEQIESQADKTGDEIDDLSDSLDKEARTTKDSTRALDDNTKSRDRHTDALDDQADALSKASRNFSANTDEVRKAVGPTEKATKATKAATEASRGLRDSVADATEAVVAHNDATRSATRVIDVNSRSMRKAREATSRHTKVVQKATETTDKATRATKQMRDERGRFTKATEKDATAWQKWDQRVRKIAGNAGKRFRPIGAFFQNYFKILGAFRAMLFSDIGAMIPQLITGIVAIGSAANATLAPLGRMLGTLGQIAPLIAAFVQTQMVVKWAIGGVSDALKVLNDEKATLEELNAAMEEAGPNTWAMAKAVRTLSDRFKPLKRDVRETFLKGLAPSVISLVDTYFPTLEKQLTRTADIMNGELKQGIKELQTPDRQQTIANVMERSAEASGLFVDIMWSLLDVFIELADAAGPAFLETLEGIDEKLDKFAGWIRDNKEDLTDFFLRANDTAGEFFRGLGGILRGLHGISQAAQPLTDFMYGGLADRLVAWGDRMNDPSAQEEMTKSYEAMIPNLEAIGNLIGSIIEGAKEIATSEWFAPLINDLADNGIPMIVEYIKKLDETVGPPLLRMSQALDGMDPDVLTSILAPLGDLLGGLATVLEVVVPLFSALPEPMQKIVMYGLGLAAMGLPGFFMLLLGPVAFVIKNFETLSKLFEKLKNSKFGKAMGKIFKPIIDFAKKWGGKLLKPLGALAKFLGKKSFAVIPVVGTAIAILWTLWDVIKWLWDNVEPFRDFITGIWDWIVDAWKGSIDWIVNTAMPWVVDAFWAVWDAIKAVGEWLGEFYRKYIKPVIDFLVFVGKLIFVTLATLFVILMVPFKVLWDHVLKPLIGWLLDTFLVGVEQLWSDIKTMAGWVVDAFWWLVDGFASGAKSIWEDVKWLAGHIWNGFKWLVDAMVGLWNGFVDVMKWVWNFIIDYIVSPALVWFQTYMWPLIKWVIDAIVWAWNGLVDVLKWVWNFIIDYIISPALVWFQTYMWPLIKWVIEKIVGAFRWMRDKIGGAWDWIKDKIYTVYTDHIKPVFDKFGEALVGLQESFRIARDAIGQIWEGLKEKVRGPAQYVIDVVYNNGIRKVWNQLADAVDLGVNLSPVNLGGGSNSGSGGSGGSNKTGSVNTRSFDVGGYTGPGSKYQPAGIVHADEFVIRKTSQRDLRREAPGFLDMLNRYGSRALSMVGVPGYDGGGKVIDSLIGGATGGGIRMGAAAAAGADGDTILNMNNPFGGMIEKFTGGLRRQFPNVGKFLDISVGMVKKLVGGASRFASEKISQAASHIGPGGPMKAGSVLGGALAGKIGGSGWGRVASAASALGLRFTSGFRPGARTAGNGSRSLHSMGRAKDYAGSASAMRAFFNAMDKPPYPTELLYTPMGGRNIHRSGRRYPNSGATARNHYDHVHVGYHGGGLVPIDHMRFMGGPVETWGNTMVGELGPEIFLPSSGAPASLLGLGGPEVVSFSQEGTVLPHHAVAALSSINSGSSGTVVEGDTIQVDIKVDGNASDQTVHDIRQAVRTAMAEIERKKKERR